MKGGEIMFDIDTSKEMKLLKRIKKLQTETVNNVAFLKDLEIDSDNFYLRKLLQKGYISYTQSDDWGSNIDAFVLTDEGKQLRYYRRQHIKNILLKSVVLPIVVAFLTTLLTNYFLPFIISLLNK